MTGLPGPALARAAMAKRRAIRVTSRRVVDPREQHQLPWIDGLAISCLLALGGMVAQGWFDPMLPWAH